MEEETKEEVDFVLLIMNCEKYKWKAELQKASWLPLINLKYYHVLGNETLTTEYEFDNYSNILWVKTKDDYNSLPDKVISSYQAISKTFKFKYLFKTDDDQRMIKNPVVFFKTLTEVIKTNQSHYGGFIVDVKKPYLSSYDQVHKELPNNVIVQATKYCSGRFYFLSTMAIDDLILKREEIIKEYFEDYAVGYYLGEDFKKNMFHIETHKIFQDILNNVV
jgi:hypothetical protein